jgi:hypothetical protein
MGSGTRATEIKQRRHRRAKLKALRGKYAEAKSAGDKEKILAKASRLTPWLSDDHFKTLAKEAKQA